MTPDPTTSDELLQGRISVESESSHTGFMYHYNPETALEELKEDASLPHPVHLRDMIVRTNLTPERALELNRRFQEYLRAFGETQAIAKAVLEELVEI